MGFFSVMGLPIQPPAIRFRFGRGALSARSISHAKSDTKSRPIANAVTSVVSGRGRNRTDLPGIKRKPSNIWTRNPADRCFCCEIERGLFTYVARTTPNVDRGILQLKPAILWTEVRGQTSKGRQTGGQNSPLGDSINVSNSERFSV